MDAGNQSLSSSVSFSSVLLCLPASISLCLFADLIYYDSDGCTQYDSSDDTAGSTHIELDEMPVRRMKTAYE